MDCSLRSTGDGVECTLRGRVEGVKCAALNVGERYEAWLFMGEREERKHENKVCINLLGKIVFSSV